MPRDDKRTSSFQASEERPKVLPAIDFTVMESLNQNTELVDDEVPIPHDLGRKESMTWMQEYGIKHHPGLAASSSLSEQRASFVSRNPRK